MNKTNVELVIFDFDGTIVNDLCGENTMVKEFGVKNLIRLYFADRKGKTRNKALCKIREIVNGCSNDLTLRTDVIPFVNRLNGCKTAILSLNTHKTISNFLDKNGLFDKFDAIIGCEDVQRLKPYPNGLNLIINVFGTTKDKTLYVGNSWIDRLTGLLARVKTVSSIAKAEEFLK